MYERLFELKKEFKKEFRVEPTYYLDTGGRFEIVGNHTDHNHGKCLVANASLRIHCVCAKNDRLIKIKSKGFRSFSIYLDELEYNEKDNKTKRLIKGIIYKLQNLGYKIGGFFAYLDSDIPYGSGVSSSAAVESLFGYLISYLFNRGNIDPLTIAKVGQFSENNYFNKPCGLLDQIGTSFDACNYIDFENIENPVVETVQFDLPLSLYLVKSEGDHSNLTPLYAEIPASMRKGAELFDGKEYLREVDEGVASEKMDKVGLSEHEKEICRHFYLENTVVSDALEALKTKDTEKFLDCVKRSQNSSKNNLKNTMVEGEYEGSPQEIIDKVEKFLRDNGAVRIHGGGFKGTVIIFVKNSFKKEMEKFLGETYPKEEWFKVQVSKKAVCFKKLLNYRNK